MKKSPKQRSIDPPIDQLEQLLDTIPFAPPFTIKATIMKDLFAGQAGITDQQLRKRLSEIIAQLGNTRTVKDIERARRLLEDLRDQLQR